MLISDLSLFKVAFGIVRDNSDLIYKGFGFKHLSDVTKYYLHPDNRSKKAQTSLCQAIGEACALFLDFVKSYDHNKSEGGLFYNKDADDYLIKFPIPFDWHDNSVYDKNISFYIVRVKKHDITLCAYDSEGNMIPTDADCIDKGDGVEMQTPKSQETQLLELYKICSSFVVLLSKDFLSVNDIETDIYDFLNTPNAEKFAILCEDFYQTHKYAKYQIKYADLKGLKTNAYVKFSIENETPRETNNILIKKFADIDFSVAQKELIPNLSEEFRLDGKLVSICNAITFGDIKSILLHGPAGTGKTISCKLICQSVGLPVMETVNCTENLDEFVLGKYIPENGEIIFKESFVTKAVRDGGAVVFEEINFAKPQYLAFLNSLLDDNGFVRLDNGEIVRRHKNFRFFATMNVGYFGTKQLNQALYNRFNAIVEIAQLSDKAVERMLVFRVPECKPHVQKILNVYHKIKKKIETEELDIVISPRNLENWARLAKYEGYVQAAEKTIIPVAKCDRLLEKNFRSVIEIYKWD
ncbi:MAG: AAA family ATPase [Bacteroidales bacterium]|nr:AAA family ATPase [Bacteroidales bacterium]